MRVLVPLQVGGQTFDQCDCRQDKRRRNACGDRCFGIVFLVLTEVAHGLHVIYQQIGRLGDVSALTWCAVGAGYQAEDIALRASTSRQPASIPRGVPYSCMLPLGDPVGGKRLVGRQLGFPDEGQRTTGGCA